MLCKLHHAVGVPAQRSAGRVSSCNSRAIQQHRLPKRLYAVAEADAKVDTSAKDVEEEDVPEYMPTKQQVQSLITTLCEETDIAELQLQMGTFQLKVRRSTSGLPAVAAAAPAAYAAPAPVALPPPALATATMDDAEESVDEASIFIEAPKVGIFRTGRYAAGKRVGKGNCVNQGDAVKKGQTLAFIEQLGTFIEIKAPQGGEIKKILLEDGAPVEFKQTVFEMAPYFGGHIIGDQKWAI